MKPQTWTDTFSQPNFHNYTQHRHR